MSKLHHTSFLFIARRFQLRNRRNPLLDITTPEFQIPVSPPSRTRAPPFTPTRFAIRCGQEKSDNPLDPKTHSERAPSFHRYLKASALEKEHSLRSFFPQNANGHVKKNLPFEVLISGVRAAPQRPNP
jgi:hypothetical protein